MLLLQVTCCCTSLAAARSSSKFQGLFTGFSGALVDVGEPVLLLLLPQCGLDSSAGVGFSSRGGLGLVPGWLEHEEVSEGGQNDLKSPASMHAINQGKEVPGPCVTGI